MYKIFLIEDEPTIAETVRDHLEHWGYEVRCVQDFRHVTEEFVSFSPHLVLLDIGLPFMNGYHWCQEIRQFSKTPVIFISAEDSDAGVVTGLTMGGDDYITKPFDLSVLTAKVQAMLRRAYAMQGGGELITHRGMICNLGDATLSYQKKKVELTKNDLKILQTLLENAGRVVSRDQLMLRLWESDSFIDDNTLTVSIARLRKKLDSIGLSDVIETKKGIGYLIS